MLLLRKHKQIKDSADDILNYFSYLFTKEIKLDISCKFSFSEIF